MGEAGHLLLAHCGVVDLADLDVGFVGESVLVHPDDGLLAAVDAGLATRRGLLDAQLRHPGLDGLGHATKSLDLVDQLPGLGGQARRQCLDIVAAAERIDHLRDAGLLLQDELGIARDARRERRRESQRLVECIRVQ